MAKKFSKKEILKDNSNDKSKQENYYNLHTEAVEKLVNASDETAPEVSEQELKKYRSDGLSKIPAWIKALFIKFWFNGAVCYFIIWGLGILIPSTLDVLVVTAIVMGIVTDLLVNNAFRFFDVDGEYLRWTLFPQKKFWTFFANILYACVIMFLVTLIYEGSNFLVAIKSGNLDKVALGVEPILFGLLYLIVDLMFVGAKIFIKKLIYDANKKLTEKDKNNKGVEDEKET